MKNQKIKMNSNLSILVTSLEKLERKMLSRSKLTSEATKQESNMLR